ncbi:hypothetical protein CSB45_03935 [candidate division KSB3 bacterium]|uniref:DUF1460 domain-containing protein n=1 Tax=candidate division KSB3 bacterium TaxID=2044937 RepID=A0A2G6E8F5_9BACT|nr:MAG: hypothetical protein CSB45_03935 [candidate division KSB3 bacterium]PIE30531.1 MAG: hypothetical protein CSA57_02520 [candidate division KSB3 bacterium]
MNRVLVKIDDGLTLEAGTRHCRICRPDFRGAADAPGGRGRMRIAISVFFMLLSMAESVEAQRSDIRLGSWTVQELDDLLSNASSIQDAGQRIEFLSSLFLGHAYKRSTLIGSRERAEVLVVNLEAVDCLTYLDYVEAMRRSASFKEFLAQVAHVRYHGGNVRFEDRNHFFTDWKEFQGGYIEEVTERIGGADTKTVVKRLNDRGNGQVYIPGLPFVTRHISYIPSRVLDEIVVNRLRSGDYLGIYSPKKGLDVFHTGIVIKTDEGIYLRHASASGRYRKVVDRDLRQYLLKKPGIIVFRAVEK